MTSPQVHLFTIGHSNHPLERFIALLQQHNIDVLVDIRRFPGSRKHPQFGKDALANSLKECGIHYHWMEALGGRRSAEKGMASHNEGLRNASFRNYADYMLTPAFRAGAEKLIEAASSRRTAMMCAEGLWWQCHRRLVSDWLVSNGITVEHIFPDGKIKQHEPTAEAKMYDGQVTYPPPKSLFAEQDD